MTVKCFLFCTILTDKQLTVKIYKRPASVKRLKNTAIQIQVILPQHWCHVTVSSKKHESDPLYSCCLLLWKLGTCLEGMLPNCLSKDKYVKLLKHIAVKCILPRGSTYTCMHNFRLY